MLRLLGRANSSNVMKVIQLLEELGLPYERTDVGGGFGGNHTPEYRALNPNGVVPTLIEPGPDGDFVLWESNAILRYLASTHPDGQRFWPEDARARAHVDQWMDWQQTVVTTPQSTVFQGLIRQTVAQRDMAAIGAAAEQVGRAYAILDAALAHHGYVAGPALSLADFTLGIHVHRWFNFPLVRLDLPHLRAWYDRLLARPAFAAHVAVLPLS